MFLDHRVNEIHAAISAASAPETPFVFCVFHFKSMLYLALTAR